MQRLGKLNPEQREQIWRAVIAVLNLPPAKQQELIDGEEERRKNNHERFEQLKKEIGPIPEERGHAFFRRYFDERRAIEFQLRKEMDDRRRVLIAEMHARIKAEHPDSPLPDAPKPDGTPTNAAPDRRDHPDSPRHGGPPPPPDQPGLEAEATQKLSRLSPQQSAQIWRAVIAVLNLPEEKRLDFISTERERRIKIRDQIEEAKKEIGSIPEEHQNTFFRKYFAERRTIELQLLKEADEKRKERIAEMQERLKKEFSTAQGSDSQKVVQPPK